MAEIEQWRGTYARRFVERAAIQRPKPPIPYVRLTDEQLALLPESVREAVRIRRDLNDMIVALRDALCRALTKGE